MEFLIYAARAYFRLNHCQIAYRIAKGYLILNNYGLQYVVYYLIDLRFYRGVGTNLGTSMLIKSKNLQVIFYIATALLASAKSCLAADFSKAQKTFVPPSLIHRDLNALGTGSLDPPSNSPNSSAAPASGLPDSNNPIDSLVSGSGNAGATTGVNWSNLQNDVLANPQYIPSVNRIVTRVNILLKNGKIAEAENLTRSGLKYYPSSSILKSKFTAITTAEAETFIARGYTDLAGKKAREALACNPNAGAAKLVEGKVLQAQGLNPSTAEGHVQSGDALGNEGRLLEAGVEYKLSLNIKPTAPAHVGLGNLALSKGSVQEAHRQYETALSLDPKSALAYRQRGALRYVMQDAVGANSDFGKAVALNPSDTLSCEALVGLWKQQVANNPSINSHLGLARAYMQTNNLDAAKSEYKLVASQDPNNPALPEARRSFMLALAKQQANNSLLAAKTLEGQGALNEAQQKLDEALALNPNDPQVLLYHGQLSEKLGLYAQAHDNYMAVLKIDPQNTDAANRLKSMAQPASSNVPSAPSVAPNMQTFQQPPPGFLNYPNQGTQPAAVPNTMPTTIRVNSNSQFNLNNQFNPTNSTNSPLPQDVPLKAPLPNKSELPPDNSPYLRRDLYANAVNQNDENFTVIDSSDQLSALANFMWSVRALMLAQKQGLQLSNVSDFK